VNAVHFYIFCTAGLKMTLWCRNM